MKKIFVVFAFTHLLANPLLFGQETGVLYMNNCNGYTKFKNGEKVLSEENKYVEFNSNLEHTGSSCTDEKRRVVINFNYQ